MNNFFLEGEKGSGKSTFLQQVLLSRKEKVEGFFVVRKMTETQKISGFELHAATSLNGVVTSFVPLDDKFCFLRKENGKMTYQEHIFRLNGRKLLKHAKKYPNRMVLLDEIGGIELLDSGMFNLILTLLTRKQKVIGVFKSDANFSSQPLSMDLKNQIIQKREKIKQILMLPEENSILMSWQEKTRERVRKQVADFLG